MNKLVILDRDGVINEDSDAYIKTVEEWIPIAGSIDAIARLSRAGYTVVVATNQSGIGRGYYDVATLDAMHERLRALVKQQGGELGEIFYCPHAPEEGCDCRKPQSGLIDQIVTEYGNVTDVPLIGDSLRDLQAGIQRHCRPVLVLTGKGQKTRDQGLPNELGDVAVYQSLADFVDHFLKE
ncbi:MAG: D-glycero-beta-D-manno-heptose 1,7-bisphosphate 7-phosphatase [Alcanivorax sp.]|nr:D-glycero-beta-D-manno-heptose 1,7-bisphosphate 7-phosphatase [Alcanivorax sp.]